MPTLHLVPLIDDEEELARLSDEWEDYIEQSLDYSAALQQYERAARNRQNDLDIYIDRLVDEYDELLLQKGWVEQKLEESSLRGHTSYPYLDEKAVETFKQELGVDPGGFKAESPEDYVFAVSQRFINRDGFEWDVRKKEVSNLEDLNTLVADSRSVETLKFDDPGGEIPDTGYEGVKVNEEGFDRLLKAYRNSSSRATLQAIVPHERYAVEEHDSSVLEELLGVEVNPDLLEEIESGDVRLERIC